MNSIRQIQTLNKRELETGVPPTASWHADYHDTAYISIRGLPYTLTEGDLLTIFSQYGEATAVHLQRDKDTGKSKGFAWLKYADARSAVLAVDNLGGVSVGGRVLAVDHARYTPKEEGVGEGGQTELRDVGEEEEEGAQTPLPEEMELARLRREHDDEDPMKLYLLQEKEAEVQRARERRRQRSERGERSERGDMEERGQRAEKKRGGREREDGEGGHRHRHHLHHHHRHQHRDRDRDRHA